MTLRIGRGFTLPVEAVTETFAYLAKRGAGKSYAACVLVEEMLEAGFQVVIVDPMGSWSGLRTGANGKSAGYPIAVLGGDRGDIPLESTGGKVVAEMIAREHLSVVLDVSLFSKGERKRFVEAFAQELYRKNRDPMHLVLEEADLFAPQRPQPGEQPMLGAVEDLVRRGRARGIGVTLITQRAAVLNKDVLTQTECLVALRTTGPQDRSAVKAWIDVVADPSERDRVMQSLPSLPIGEAWFWSPGWLGLLKRVKIRKKRTFDSSATPKAGRRRAAPKTVAQVDLAALEKRMAETIEKAKADDPKLLRKRIAELEREAAKKPAQGERVEVPVFDEKAFANLTRKAFDVGMKVEDAKTAAEEAGEMLQRLIDDLDAYGKSVKGTVALGEKGVAHTPSPRRAPPQSRRGTGPGDPSVGTGGLRRILVALAQRPDGLTNRQIGVRAGLSSKSGTFSTYISRGRTNGWICGGGGGVLRITEPGIVALGDYQELPAGAALLEHWLRELGSGGASRLLRVIAEAYPRALTNTEAAEAADLSAKSGTFSTYLSKLRTLQLIEGRGELRASEELF